MSGTSGRAHVNGTRLYFEVAGSGPALVLLHGFSLDTRMWDDQFDVFAREFRVVRYDQRGFGKSDVPTDEPYSGVEDLRSLLDYLAIETTHLIGLSLGGGQAIDFALTQPAMVDSLIVAGSGFSGYEPVHDRHTAADIDAAGASEGIDAARARWLDWAIFEPGLRNPGVGSRLRQIVDEYSGWHWVNDNSEERAEPRAVERLEEISARTLVIVGELDGPDFHEIANTLTERIPDATKVLIPDVGHMSNMEAPEHFNRTVLEFLRPIA